MWHNLGKDVCHIFLGPFHSVAIFCGLVDIKYSDLILSDMPVSDNDKQCAHRPDGTLKDTSEIPWFNDPDNTEPILVHGLGAPSLNLNSDPSTTASLKGKEPAQLVGSRCTIKPTTKARQASLTRFFLTRTVLVDSKESTQTSSANSGNSSPAVAVVLNPLVSLEQVLYQRPYPVTTTSCLSQTKCLWWRYTCQPRVSRTGDSTPTAGKGTQKHTKASVSVGPKKCIKTTIRNQDVESDTDDDQDFTISDGEARGSDGGDDTEEEGRYEQMRQDADQDRKGIRRTYSHNNDPHTEDIRQVFFDIKRDVNGQKKKGHMCDICKKLGVSDKDTFFTSTSVLTLRTHIACAQDTHREVYLKRCKEAGVDPHLRAIGNDDNDKNMTLTQVNLDGFMQRIPTWSKQGLMEHVIQFVVEDNQLFLVVEKLSFCNMLRYLHPNMKDLDIPHRTKLQDEVLGATCSADSINLLDDCGLLINVAFDSDGDGLEAGGDGDWTADWKELKNTLDNEETLRKLTPALDPTIKLEYCKANWDQEHITAGAEALERILLSATATVCPHRAQALSMKWFTSGSLEVRLFCLMDESSCSVLSVH
ncbi:hypothetical protein EDB89DRAFT_1909195 [Lactarius sanguifluus]|nr:hypothetical protein EDB89DRAFT_1909195 [Lactarius sanguifluus]